MRQLVDRLGPTGVAALVAAVLVLFGLGSLIVPALTDGGGTSNAERAAPPAAPAAEPAASSAPAASGAPSSAATTPGAARTTLVAANFNTGYEDRVVQLINGERRKEKCQPLRVDAKLRAAARGTPPTWRPGTSPAAGAVTAAMRPRACRPPATAGSPTS
ncbi:spore germination YkwD domain-containing protein [Dactylosporangium darangshiense]|uniref:hypothetical protein n=1 Tax=Dactylosporangium darangshiense TaxID=579108 RepID=UPI00363C62B3